jgi:hypothetical protein
VTPFEQHQRLEGGRITCLDPETAVRASGQARFSVWYRLSDGRPVWGRALLPGESSDAHSRMWREKIPADPHPPGTEG